MADTSVYGTILDTMATQIGNLGIVANNASVPVAVRRLPKKEESPLDVVPLIAVAPSERPEEIEPFTTEDEVLVKYVAEVVYIAANNRDFTETNLDAWLRIREQIRRNFQFGISNISLPAGANLFFSKILPETPLDRSNLNKMYDYMGINFQFWVQEQRTE